MNDLRRNPLYLFFLDIRNNIFKDAYMDQVIINENHVQFIDILIEYLEEPKKDLKYTIENCYTILNDLNVYNYDKSFEEFINDHFNVNIFLENRSDLIKVMDSSIKNKSVIE